MIERLQAKRSEEGGFTLIELLIVIIVLGILAAIVVFAVAGTRADAVESRCKTEVKSIELSAEGVLAKDGSYPATANLNDEGDLLDSANKGGLLKQWPDSNDYILQWDGTNHDVNVFPKTFSVTAGGTVEKSAGVAAVRADALGQGNAGCAAL